MTIPDDYGLWPYSLFRNTTIRQALIETTPLQGKKLTLQNKAQTGSQTRCMGNERVYHDECYADHY